MIFEVQKKKEYYERKQKKVQKILVLQKKIEILKKKQGIQKKKAADLSAVFVL